MIVLNYQESTTEKFFENARDNLSFFGGATKSKKKWDLVGPGLRIFRNF